MVSLPANITGPLTDGLPIQVKIAHTNTGASVMNYNASGNANMVNVDGSALVANQVKANAIVLMQYSNAMGAWQVQTPTAGITFPQASPSSNSLAANVSLNTSTYANGPKLVQGNVGTFFVSGGVTVTDTGASVNITAKLWDGTTVIDSAVVGIFAANGRARIPLSGNITNPAGNLVIDVLGGSNSSLILANISGNGKDSTLSAFRIG